jgi:hypothetical protein
MTATLDVGHKGSVCPDGARGSRATSFWSQTTTTLSGGAAVVEGDVKRNSVRALPLGRAEKRVRSWGFLRNRGQDRTCGIMTVVIRELLMVGGAGEWPAKACSLALRVCGPVARRGRNACARLADKCSTQKSTHASPLCREVPVCAIRTCGYSAARPGSSAIPWLRVYHCARRQREARPPLPCGIGDGCSGLDVTASLCRCLSRSIGQAGKQVISKMEDLYKICVSAVALRTCGLSTQHAAPHDQMSPRAPGAHGPWEFPGIARQPRERLAYHKCPGNSQGTSLPVDRHCAGIPAHIACKACRRDDP